MVSIGFPARGALNFEGPTRRQVLIPLTPAAAEMVVANAVLTVESCNKGLVSARYKLRVESVHKA